MCLVSLRVTVCMLIHLRCHVFCPACITGVQVLFAIMSCETTEAFLQVLRAFQRRVEATAESRIQRGLPGMVKPSAVFTDDCPALMHAVRSVKSR